MQALHKCKSCNYKEIVFFGRECWIRTELSGTKRRNAKRFKRTVPFHKWPNYFSCSLHIVVECCWWRSKSSCQNIATAQLTEKYSWDTFNPKLKWSMNIRHDWLHMAQIPGIIKTLNVDTWATCVPKPVSIAIFDSEVSAIWGIQLVVPSGCYLNLPTIIRKQQGSHCSVTLDT